MGTVTRREHGGEERGNDSDEGEIGEGATGGRRSRGCPHCDVMQGTESQQVLHSPHVRVMRRVQGWGRGRGSGCSRHMSQTGSDH